MPPPTIFFSPFLSPSQNQRSKITHKMILLFFTKSPVPRDLVKNSKMGHFSKISNVGHFQYALYRICNASMTLIIFVCGVLGKVVSKKLCLLNYATSYYFFQPFTFLFTKPKIKNTPKIWHIFEKFQMWVISNMHCIASVMLQ